MVELRNGENTKYTSKSGTIFWVHNINGSYYVENIHGSRRTATKEIKANIKLI